MTKPVVSEHLSPPEQVILACDEPDSSGKVACDWVVISGWALAESGIDKIEVYIGNQFVGVAEYGGYRPDVAIAQPAFDQAERSGFRFNWDSKTIQDGENQLLLRAISKNGHTYELVRKIIVANTTLRDVQVPVGSNAQGLEIDQMPDNDPNMVRLNEMLEHISSTASPKELFGDFSDDCWFWVYTEGYRRNAKLRQILPAMPEESVQIRFTGAAGDTTLREAFSAYTLFKEIAKDNLEDSTNLNTVLDFGCGWGRIIRFFLKDVEPTNLWGIDCFPEAIEICQQTNKWCKFELINPLPPTSFSDNTFDMIYCYSVFSHLAEETHQEWLLEFRRILKPGGLLIATTRPREFILMCAGFRAEKNPASWQSALARAFPDAEKALSDYDSGKYVHTPLGGGGVLDPSFYGETCIPKGYVLRHWTKHFEFLDFIDDRRRSIQDVIVVKKRL